MRAGDLPTHGGRTLAYVYDSGLAEVDALAAETVAAFAGTNGLDPTAFPSLAAMERDLVAFAGGLLDAPPGHAGSVTSGGTESCLLAVLAARDARPDVEAPELVLPSTAHAAFHKAAHLFGLRTVVVDVDPATFRADPAATAAAITDRTVLVVASAPSYAHGVVDPVAEIASAAAGRGVRCHVDACIGGWVLPFLDDDPSRPAWTFAVDGVTSISVDLHKYGYAPKGASLLLHRTHALRRSQLFAWAEWPGYTVVNPTLQSTRPGGPLAGAWATVQAIGDRRLPQARADGARRHPRRRGRRRRRRGAARGRPSRLDAARRSGPTSGWTCSPSPTRWPLAAGSCSPSCGSGRWRRRCTCRSAPPRRSTSWCATWPRRPRRRGRPDRCGSTRRSRPWSPGSTPRRSTSRRSGGCSPWPGSPTAPGGWQLPARMAPVNALLDACPPPVRAALVAAVVDLLGRTTVHE